MYFGPFKGVDAAFIIPVTKKTVPQENSRCKMAQINDYDYGSWIKVNSKFIKAFC
jgi:hypothetical protein